jgi:hypothetical protein
MSLLKVLPSVLGLKHVECLSLQGTAMKLPLDPHPPALHWLYCCVVWGCWEGRLMYQPNTCTTSMYSPNTCTTSMYSPNVPKYLPMHLLNVLMMYPIMY